MAASALLAKTKLPTRLAAPGSLGPTLVPCCPLQFATPLPTACKPPAPQGAPPPQVLGLTPTHPSDHGPNTTVACPCWAVPTALPVPDLSPGGSAGAPWREPPKTLLVPEPTFSPRRDRLVDEASALGPPPLIHPQGPEHSDSGVSHD